MSASDFLLLLERGAAGSGGGGSSTLAVADFKNGVYSIGGTTKTLAQMFVEGDDFLYAQVSAGVGWRVPAVPGILYHYAYASSALLAALAGGFTGVIEFQFEEPAPPQMASIRFYGDGVTTQWLQAYVNIGDGAYDPYMGLYTQDYGTMFSASDYDYYASGGDEPDTLHKLAATILDAGIDGSYDGNPKRSITAPVLDGNALPGEIALGLAARHATSLGGAVIEKVTFYSPKPATELPGLSA